MRNYDLITPEGTKDLLFGECIVRRDIEKSLFELFRSRGYSEMITPGLEFFDVFNLNSSYFPQENLYKLTDSKGRLLVMRPDSTMPIARVVATRLRDAMLPLKLCYNQTVYRTEPALKGRSDEIFQAGIELIGSDLKIADLEVISTAVESLRSFGMEFSLEIGNIGIFKELVDRLEVSDHVKEKIRQNIEGKNFPALNDLLLLARNQRVDTPGLRTASAAAFDIAVQRVSYPAGNQVRIVPVEGIVPQFLAPHSHVVVEEILVVRLRSLRQFHPLDLGGLLSLDLDQAFLGQDDFRRL